MTYTPTRPKGSLMGEKTVPCPRGCGTQVPVSKAGDPHIVYDLHNEVQWTCK